MSTSFYRKMILRVLLTGALLAGMLLGSVYAGALSAGLPGKLSAGKFQAANHLFDKLMPVAHADTVQSELTYELREDKVNYQFIITGENDAFEVNLVLPDGTKAEHDLLELQEDMPYLYVGLENERIWVVRDAVAGQYRFEIVSEGEQRFRVAVKDPIRMVETMWGAPLNERMVIQDAEALVPLAWNVSGDVRSRVEQLYVWLQPLDISGNGDSAAGAGGAFGTGGGAADQASSINDGNGTNNSSGSRHTNEGAGTLSGARSSDSETGGSKMPLLPAGSYWLSAEQASFAVPPHFPDGEYRLLLTADTRGAEKQVIDPDVIIAIKHETPSVVQVTDAKFLNRMLFTDIKLPRNLRWDELRLQLWSDSDVTESHDLNAGAGIGSNVFIAQRSDLEQLPLTEDNPNDSLWRWEVAQLDADGTYGGLLQVYDRGELVAFVQMPEVVLQIRDWEKDSVTWSIDDEMTNHRHVEVAFQLQADTEVQIISEGPIVHYHDIVPKTVDGKSFVLQLELMEGDAFFQVIMSDAAGNVHTSSKRYLVDHAPPRLEMIQPLPQHDRAEQGFASGFVEPEAVLVVNGKQVEADEHGYFKVDNIRAALQVEVTDTAGNTTVYQWQRTPSASPWLWIVLANLAVLGAAAGAIFWMKRKWGTSASSQS